MSVVPSTELSDKQKMNMQVHGYAPQLVIEVQSIIDKAIKGEMAPNTAFEDIWDVLFSQNIAKLIDPLVEKVMVHPTNRGGLGVNAYNCHKNGYAVDKAGCDLMMLNKTTVFELCPLDPQKSFQKEFNLKLVENSKGLLAPINGTEEWLSVGCGHWIQWCRAIKAGCRTPFKEMANSEGKLSQDRFAQKDARMGVALKNGWKMRALPWQCEVAWPQLPGLAQRALNSSHQVSSRSTEIEVMVDACEKARDLKLDNEEFQDILKSCAMAGPVCAEYITHVGELGLQIGGGSTSPVLFFLDRFAKAFGENKVLGEEFVKAVAGMSVSKTDKIQFFKTALVATNLVSTKVVDGISKLITKSDVERCRVTSQIQETLSINGTIAKV